MKMIRWAAWLIFCTAALASDGPNGTVPRPAADKYPAHAQQSKVAIGAILLSAGEVRKQFFADVNRCCFVVEVALFPSKDVVVEPLLDDFALRITGQSTATKPTTPSTAALHGSRDTDRLRPNLIRAMEQELIEKALPLNATTTPVSGFLYFPKGQKGKYQLEYTVGGSTVVLPLQGGK